MGQNQFLTSLALISIFTLALLSLAIGYATENSADINIGQSGYATGINTTISDNSVVGFNIANASGTTFIESEVSEDSESGTFVKGTEFKNADKADKANLFSILRNSQAAIFGEDQSFNKVFNIIIALIIAISAALIYKTWVGKNPD